MPARVAYDALGLPPAEHDVVRLLADGLYLEEVAARRCVSRNTVRNQVASARERTGARTCNQLCALLARAEGKER
jgi:DNA-binding CsgD family transcriptional regulator